MTATWAAPIDFDALANLFVDADDLNTYLRNNMEWLRSRPRNATTLTTVTTTSTSFIKVTGSDTSLTSVGGGVLIVANGTVGSNTAGATTNLDIAIDGTRQGDATIGLTGITSHAVNYRDNCNMFWYTATPPSATSHDYSVYWKASSGTSSCLLRIYVVELR